MLISVFEQLRTSAFEFKEELEDVIAEAKYENMKNNSEMQVITENTLDESCN